MPECPITIEDTKAPSGPGRMFRIQPLGFASDNDCVVKMYIGSTQVTGIGDYEGFHVDGYAQNGMLQINPPPGPGAKSTVTFVVFCPNCATVKIIPIDGGPDAPLWKKILTIAGGIALGLLAFTVITGTFVLFGVLIGLLLRQ